MKRPEEIKPECEAKLTTMGDANGFIIPKWFVSQWQMQKGKRYKISVVEELSPISASRKNNHYTPGLQSKGRIFYEDNRKSVLVIPVYDSSNTYQDHIIISKIKDTVNNTVVVRNTDA